MPFARLDLLERGLRKRDGRSHITEFQEYYDYVLYIDRTTRSLPCSSR